MGGRGLYPSLGSNLYYKLVGVNPHRSLAKPKACCANNALGPPKKKRDPEAVP